MKSSGAQIALITGGAGFVGSNLAQRLLEETDLRVRVLDNLSRRGVEHNVAWLRSLRGAASRLEIIQGDVRNARDVREAVRDAGEIYHLASQVAVTTSIDDPETDFDTNAAGTFRVLEAARRSPRNPFLLFTSTNKVYGSLHGVPVTEAGTRYIASDPAFRGVTESEPLDFHSPYGCSKGTADQYVRDYARIYNLPTVVFRMSCIAGPRQFGNEDQGWVAHFLYSALDGTPITVYGDGHQVRDILHVGDLTDAMLAARAHRRTRAAKSTTSAAASSAPSPSSNSSAPSKPSSVARSISASPQPAPATSPSTSQTPPSSSATPAGAPIARSTKSWPTSALSGTKTPA